jgi:putative oxidoreductase
MQQYNVAMLVLRVVFGLFVAAHGYNKVFGPNGLNGTTGWFKSMGMKWPRWQARVAATTELGAGGLLALGLLTPFAAAGLIGLMVVAIYTVHLKNGFYIFRKGEGWEYCAAIATAAFSIAMLGPAKYSLDNAFGIDWHGWTGAVIAGLLGVGGGIAQLVISYRPKSVAA